MTQPKGEENKQDKTVKLIKELMPGDMLKVLENGIKWIIEAELDMLLKANPYNGQMIEHTIVMFTENIKILFLSVHFFTVFGHYGHPIHKTIFLPVCISMLFLIPNKSISYPHLHLIQSFRSFTFS